MQNYTQSFLGEKNTVQQMMLMDFLRFLQPVHANILDLGCGPGINAKLIAEKYPDIRIAGIDLGKAMIAKAKESVPQGVFLRGDFRKTRYPKSAFDAVILASVAPHLTAEDLQNILSAISYTLKPDGLLFMNFWSGEYSGFKQFDFADRPVNIHYYDTRLIWDMMRASSFANLSTKSFQKQLHMKNTDEDITETYYYGHSLKDLDIDWLIANY